jgi:uncharacterized membrane protein
MLEITAGIISMFFWGVVDFLSAKVIRKIGSLLTFFWAQIVGLSVIIVYFALGFQKLNLALLSSSVLIVIIAAFFFTLGTLFFYKGLNIGQASIVCPLMGSWSMITVVLSVIFLHEALMIYQIAAIILIILGIVLVSVNIKDALKNRLSFFAGVSEGIISMLGYGLATFLLAFSIKTLGWFFPAAFSRLFMVIFLFIYALITRQSLRARFQFSIWKMVLAIGSLDVLAVFAYSIGVSSGYAALIAPIAAASPLVTIILARIFFKEKLAINQLLGVIMAIAGIILIAFR